MLKLMPIPHVLHMKEIIPTSKPIIVAGKCSPVDWMYVTAMPAIATLTMAEKHIKIDSTRLQLQPECWNEQEQLPQA